MLDTEGVQHALAVVLLLVWATILYGLTMIYRMKYLRGLKAVEVLLQTHFSRKVCMTLFAISSCLMRSFFCSPSLLSMFFLSSSLFLFSFPDSLSLSFFFFSLLFLDHNTITSIRFNGVS